MSSTGSTGHFGGTRGQSPRVLTAAPQAAPLDVASVRRRFSALDRPLAFFDAPGGTQVPDEVVAAISAYLRESNANLGGTFATSRGSDLLLDEARRAAAGFLGCASLGKGAALVFGARSGRIGASLERLGAELALGFVVAL